ncbi:MAG: hypothetical protein WCF18_22245 [Chthoniobacteraceae bacterium]
MADDPTPGSGWRRLAQARWPWIVVLLAVALAYYGSYVRYGIGFRDEGQTVALGAQRLLDGEVPFRDVVLNYNVLWFYPVVGLFKLFGVSYVLLRGYCLALSTVTAVLGFLLVEKTTRRPWLAFLVALVLVLIPGSPFKNYIPLLAVANTFCLLQVALTPANSRAAFWETAVGGVVLGLSFLIRIDIALLFLAIWSLLLVVRLLIGSAPFAGRARVALTSLVLLLATAAALHWPVWMDAKRRGFDRQFAEQYLEKWRMLERPVTRLFHRPPARASLPAHAGVHAQTPRRAALNGADEEAPPADKQTLQRASLKSLTKVGQNSGPAFVFLCYAPLLAIGIFVPCGLFAWVGGLRRRDGELERRGLAILVMMGGALSTFPQFFFFRPDVPHLSEFMPGFLTASAAAAGLLWTGVANWRNWRALFTAFLLAIVAVYLVRILPDRWAGTFAIRNKRTKLFTAENGVRVYVSSRESAGLTEIQRLLRAFAPNPRDYVACYPYSPGINLLANRPTYERNVYVDNATRTTHWDAEAIARFEKFQPAVIVLSDWDINGSKASRFSVWAVKTKTWIQTHYTHQGAYVAGSDAFEIYTREPVPPR